MPHADVNGQRIYFEDTGGDGPDEITCPALVVHGTDDVSISMDKAETLATRLTGCDGVVKVGGAHAANLTNPGPVNDAILAFLSDLPA